MGPQYLGDPQRRSPGGPGQLQRDVRRVVPAPPGPGGSHDGMCGHGDTQLPFVHSTTHRAQHGTGELDGGHGTRVWEEGGGYASRFGLRSGMWTGLGGAPAAEASTRGRRRGSASWADGQGRRFEVSTAPGGSEPPQPAVQQSSSPENSHAHGVQLPVRPARSAHSVCSACACSVPPTGAGPSPPTP
ncbi:hypothetical protein SBD_3971 [Streptomyces bottropensis ATCC 25435]|uniref:Uncharacterized protein n=1 Tax=Streptomyces bottropensis ATCC 25435 TaxID=1054862 RepID=M3EYJ5_9ACTN|nr:hypothetical protein SBD_3971 [Streptomyces bottropensis ATCC 25435]